MSVRARFLGFLKRTVLWIVGIGLVVFTSVVLFDPLPVAAQLDRILPAARLLLVLILDVGLLGFVYLQIRQTTSGDDTGLMVRSSGAVTRVDIESARDRVLKAVRTLPDIDSVDAQVQALHGKADIQLDVAVAGDTIDVPSKQKEIDRALQQVINKQLGLQMAGRPRIHIRIRGAGKGVEPAPAGEIVSVVPPVESVMPVETEEQPVAPKIEEETAAALEVPQLVIDEKEAAGETVEEEPSGGLLGGLWERIKQDEKPEEHGPTAETSPEVPAVGEAESGSADEESPDMKPDSET